MENHEWDSPAQSPSAELPAKVPRRWVGAGSESLAPTPEAPPPYKPDRSWDKLLILVGIAVIVAAVLIVPGILNRGGQNPVAEAAQATMDSSGVRMNFSATISGVAQMTMQGNGVLNGETKRAALGVAADVSAPQTSSFRMQEIVDDQDVYIRAPDAGTALGLPGGWIRFSGDNFGESGDGLLGGTSTTSPKQLLDTLDSGDGDVVLVGQEQLGKKTVTHYTANIDVDSFINQISDEYGDGAADFFKSLNPTETVDAWIDGQGLLRRMTANATFGSLMTMAATVDFSDYGISPQIDVPPDSQVQDLSGISS